MKDVVDTHFRVNT